MRYYTYFPGCSCSSEGGAKAYSWSIQAVSRALDIELIELDDWNCCGSTPSGSVDELGCLLYVGTRPCPGRKERV